MSLLSRIIILPFGGCSCRHLRTSAVRRLLPRNLRGYTTSDQREADYKRRDNVPPFYKLIYRGPLEAYIAWSVHMSTFSACAITVAALVAHLRGDVVRPMLTDWDLVSEPNDIYYFALGFLVINVMVRLVVSKIPLRIYKIDNESSVNYLAIYYPQLPFMQSRLQFRQGDVRPYSFYLSPWNNLSYQLGHHKSFIFMDYFKTPSEFHELFLTSDNTVKGQRHDQ